MFVFSHGTIRWALLICGLLACVIGFAQKAPDHAYTIRFNAPITQAQEKFIHEALRNQDPDALVWINAAEQNALTRVHVALDRDQLQADVAPSGAVIIYLGRPVVDHPSAKSASPNSAAQPPAYKDSGDPATDNARYEVEKKAWIDAHPAAYEQLTLPE